MFIAVATVGVFIAAAGPGPAYAGCESSNKPSSRLSKDKARNAVVCLINKERSGQNVKSHKKLEKAAQGHTAYMRMHNCFSHQCSGESGLVARVKRTGYSSTPSVGEVILSYPDLATPRHVVRAWMNSRLHKEQILGRKYDDIGVGVSTRNGVVLYTADLAHK